MVALRFRQRHVHQTISDYLVSNLQQLGWGNSAAGPDDPVNANVNFGGVPMTFVETPPDEAGVAIAANSMSIAIGDEPSDQVEQLGGGLISVGYPLIVDIYGQDHSFSVSISQDVKDLLSRKVIPLYSYMAVPRTPVAGSYIEFEDVIGPERPEGGQTASADSFRRYWRTMRATATTYFSQD